VSDPGDVLLGRAELERAFTALGDRLARRGVVADVCPGCGSLLLHADREPQSPHEWEQWLKGLRKAISRTAIATPGGGPPDENARCLTHTSCARHRNTARAARPPQLPPEPSGLA